MVVIINRNISAEIMKQRKTRKEAAYASDALNKTMQDFVSLL